MGNCNTKRERIKRLVPNPERPGEMLKEIKINKSCGCMSKFGRNGTKLTLNSHFDYNNTIREDVKTI